MTPTLINGSSLTSIRTNPYNPDISTADTIRVMKQLAKDSSKSQLVSSAVEEATRYLSNSAKDSEIVRSIFYWIKDHIKFVTDEEMLEGELNTPIPELGMELLKSPDVLLITRTGDCDDFSTLLASMLINLGFKNRFVTIAADRNLPNKFSHVYLTTFLEDCKRWIPLDCSHGKFPGWEHNQIFRRQEWGI